MADPDVEQGYLFDRDGDLAAAEAAYRRADERGDAEGALWHGVLLEERGELDAARAAYLRAEQRGDPRASCNLAAILKSLGDLAGAEAAYRRAEAQGLGAGAYGVGQLLYARGDIAGSIVANQRADALGDVDGTFNLGVLLRNTGDLLGAEDAFRRAAERGHADGLVAYGRLLEQRDDLAGAEAVFRQAAALDDPAGTFALGALLLQRDRVAEGMRALRRAGDLGHAGAEVVQAIEAQYGGRVAMDIHLSLVELEEFHNAVVSQRAKLAATWAAHHRPIVVLEQGLQTLNQAIERRVQAVNDLLQRHSDLRYAQGPTTNPGTSAYIFLNVLSERDDGTLGIDPEFQQRLDAELSRASQKLNEAAFKTMKGRLRAQAIEHIDDHGRLLALMEHRRTTLTRDLEAARERQKTITERADAQAVLEAAAAAADAAEQRLPATLRPWTDDVWRAAWREQPASLSSAHLYLGRLRPVADPQLGDNAVFGIDRSVPYTLTPRTNMHLVHTAAQRAQVHSLVRSMLLRALLSAEPGKVRLTFFDPIGLGQSVSSLLDLAEYDSELIGGKVWSATADLERRLGEHTAHIELVIQKYLRSTYASIDDFNQDAGEVAEPYRYLVVFDFPSGFTEAASKELLRVLENGPRCGVRTLLLTNADIEVPHGVSLAAIAAQERPFHLGADHSRESDGFSMDLVYEPDSDRAVPAALVRDIVEHVGRRSATRSEAVVTLDGVFGLFREAAARGIAANVPAEAAAVDLTNADTWWRCSTADMATAPIGRAGAREMAALTFDSGNHAGALLVGRPGSGKSTLLHSFIQGLTTIYGPQELELYLIDFKEGVEFQVYARESLPHARCVAIESDREFGLSVLQSLEAELKRRGNLLRSSGGQHASLTALRRATNEVIPRVLLIFDEFHVLFSRNDKVGLAAATLLEMLVRQGRSFGIHVLLGSQSLAGLDALGSHVPQLLPTRILLPATEADARTVLGDGNQAGQYLTKHGQGILNTAGGAVEANQPFQGAFSDEAERQRRMAVLREKADAAGFTRQPIVFEGNAATPIESVSPARFCQELATAGRSPLRIRVGSPMTIAGTADISLGREPGANVLVVARDAADAEGGATSTLPRSLLVVALASLAASPAGLDVVDFTAIDDGLDATLGPLLERGRATVHRRRGFDKVLRDLGALVRARIADDDTSGEPRVLFLYGVHRARMLDAAGLDSDPELVDTLEEVVRDGPEVGIHTWIWCETVGVLSRRLPRSIVREFSWRLAGKQSPDDSQMLLGSDDAAEVRERQIVLVNDDRGLVKRCTTFTVPTETWLSGVLDESRR